MIRRYGIPFLDCGGKLFDGSCLKALKRGDLQRIHLGFVGLQVVLVADIDFDRYQGLWCIPLPCDVHWGIGIYVTGPFGNKQWQYTRPLPSFFTHITDTTKPDCVDDDIECTNLLRVDQLPSDSQICARLTNFQVQFLDGLFSSSTGYETCAETGAGLSASLEANPTSIVAGESTTLSWTIANSGRNNIQVSHITITRDIVGATSTVYECTSNCPFMGSTVDYPPATSTYNITVNGTVNGSSDFFATPAPNVDPGPTVTVYGPPTLKVLYNGSPLSAGDKATITDTPAMPTLTAQLIPAAGEAFLPANVTWYIEVKFTGPDKDDNGNFVVHNDDLFPSAPRYQPATQTWNITSDFASVIEGGTATIHYQYGNQAEQQFTFYINGQNPQKPDIVNEILNYPPGGPWYALDIASKESSFRQFFTQDTTIKGQFFAANSPYFGAPHGFGIFQVDPPNVNADVWDWTTNVADGIDDLNRNQIHWNDKWATQVKAFNDWNQQHPDQQLAPPANKSEGTNCVFSFAPTGTQKSFADALAIKVYNGADDPFIQFVPTAANPWLITDTQWNPTYNMYVNYVSDICSQNP